MKTKAFACYSKNIVSRMKSSSGGIFVLLAEQIISENGVVYAAVYTTDFRVEHRKISHLSDLESAMGAKYAQSHLGTTFNSIKRDLEDGRKVLFVGTPCQCAGLKAFLNGKDEKLVCVDFICHGVPSPKVLKQYLIEISKNDRLSILNMRDKTTGWEYFSYSWKYVTISGKETIIKSYKVPYMKGFSANLFLRPSCYECRFKGVDRITDLTMGDYWGVEIQMPDMSDNRGTSLIMVHSDIGRRYIDILLKHMIAKEVDIYKAIQGNPSALYSSKNNDKRRDFFKQFSLGENCIGLIEKMTKQRMSERILGKARKHFNTFKKKIRGIMKN